MRKHVLYLGWVGFGNLGDDICRDLFIKHVNEIASEEGYDIHVTSLFPARFSRSDLLSLNPDLVVLGGGSLLESPYIEAFILAQTHNIPTMIWGSGVDSVLQPATRIFQDPTATSKQLAMIVHYSGYAGAALLQGVGNCTFGGVRGPDTFTLLKELGCELSQVQIGGDPGLLFTGVGTDAALDVLPSADERPVVGINWGTTRNNLYGKDEAKARAAFAQALRTMADHHRFVLFAMWKHDLTELRELASEINRSDAVVYWDDVPSGARLAALFSRCAFTINLKLHANVFSAALGCPFISVAYRSKCFDFAHSLECGQFVIPTDTPDLADTVVAKSDELLHSIDTWKAQIKVRRDRYVGRLRQLLAQCVRIMSQ